MKACIIAKARPMTFTPTTVKPEAFIPKHGDKNVFRGFIRTSNILVGTHLHVLMVVKSSGTGTYSFRDARVALLSCRDPSETTEVATWLNQWTVLHTV